jgi:hypothetical protein
MPLTLIAQLLLQVLGQDTALLLGITPEVYLHSELHAAHTAPLAINIHIPATPTAQLLPQVQVMVLAPQLEIAQEAFLHLVLCAELVLPPGINTLTLAIPAGRRQRQAVRHFEYRRPATAHAGYSRLVF